MDAEKSAIFSIKLSKCMDLLGYSYSMVKYRQEMNQHMDCLFNKNKQFSHQQLTTTGSKGEGTAKYFESDIDRLCCLEGISCINGDTITGADINPESSETQDRYGSERYAVFEVITEGCSPGYARLKLKKLTSGHFRKTLELSLVHTNEGTFIDNSFPKVEFGDFDMVDVNVEVINPKGKSGPSKPYSNSHISYDFVNGFVYEDKGLLLQWAEIHESTCSGWPSKELVQRVRSTNGQLVPVANKTSQYPNTEWRVCFTDAELVLVRSLNECQIKVFILLKLVSKTFLKPICKEISSYAMKNIIMWVAERFTEEQFQINNLYDRFRDAMYFLKECIEQEQLKSYMIPERNLFEGRITICQKRRLVIKLKVLISQGTSLFDNIGDFGRVLKASESEMKVLRKNRNIRDRIEIMLLKKNVEFKKIEQEWYRRQFTVDFEILAETHEGYNKYDKQMKDLLEENDSCEGCDFHMKLRNVLS